MSTASILVGAKTEILLRQLSSLRGYFSIQLSVCLSVCPSICLSVHLSVVLTACLPVRPAAQLWALSDKTPFNAFDMWTENFDEKKYNSFYYYGNGSSSNAMPILDMVIRI